MQSSVTATVEFCFQGECLAPSMVIDLDACMQGENILREQHPVLAAKNDIDTCSYMYEVMESEDARLSDATGLAGDFVRDGRLDMQGFEMAWRQQQALEAISPIAKVRLGIDDFAQHPELIEALCAAYQAGRQDSPEIRG